MGNVIIHRYNIGHFKETNNNLCDVFLQKKSNILYQIEYSKKRFLTTI